MDIPQNLILLQNTVDLFVAFDLANKSVPFAELDGIPLFKPINRPLHRSAVQLFQQLGGDDVISVLVLLVC